MRIQGEETIYSDPEVQNWATRHLQQPAPHPQPDIYKHSCQAIAAAFEQTQSLSARIKELETQIYVKRTHIAQGRAYLSRIRNFPPELLERIFLESEPRILGSGPLLAIAEVCHFWRQVASHNPPFGVTSTLCEMIRKTLAREWFSYLPREII